MASGYTANYGLCQWQGEDKFLREEFNQDNAKIDAALKAADGKADRALSGLEAADYNIYNLLLQSEYEGKYTGYKKALLYDGFLDESRVASKSTAVQIKDRAARLNKSGQGDITTARTSGFCFLGDAPCSTGTKTATGAGRLTGISFQFYQMASKGCSIELKVILNGNEVTRQTLTFSAGESGTRSVSLTKPVDLLPGDTFSLELEYNNSSYSIYVYLTSDREIAGTIQITSLGASSGTLTAKAAEPVGTGDKALVFVKYTGGEVVPKLNSQTLTRTGRRTTVETGGQSCTEDTYEGTWSGGSLTAGFTLSCGSDSACVFHDYGIVVL